MCADVRDLRECPHGGTCRILTRANARRATRGATAVVVLFLAAEVFAHLTGIMQAVHDVVIGLGILAAVSIAVVVTLAVLRARAGVQSLRVPPLRQQVPYRQEQPIYQPRQQALPPAVHHHHGNNLVLPGVTDEGLAKLLHRGEQ